MKIYRPSLLTFILIVSSYNCFAQLGGICKYPSTVYNIANVEYPGDENIDVLFYGLDLDIDTESKILYGKVTVNLKIVSNSVNEFFLDFEDNMRVDSVESSIKNFLFEHSVNKIVIKSSAELPVNGSLSVTIYYHGRPLRTGFGGFAFDSYGGSPWVWTLSEPYAASAWFPCKDNPADKADSAEIAVTVPKNLIAVSNGKLVGDEFIIPGKRKFIWKTRYPIANYLIAVTAGKFNTYSDYFKFNGSDSMKVINYVLEPFNDDIVKYTNLTLDALNYFSGIFGIYPFANEKYGHVEFGYGGGMEHQTITSLGAWGEGIIAHELAHQWFGDKITCANWSEIWLNEGFATYSEALYREHISGFTGYLDRIKIDMNRALSAEGTVYVQDISGIPSIFDLNRTYSKGAVILHMLRGVVGDSTFFRILKSYAQNPELSYSSATTEDFKNIAEAVYGKDLDWFFDEWIFGTKFPDYDYSYQIKNSGSGSDVVVSIIQNPAGEEKRLFKMPLQLKFSGGGKDTLVTVMIDKAENKFEFRFNFPVVEIIFDPNDFVLKRSGEVAWLNGKPKLFALNQNFPNPFNGRTAITFALAKRSNVKLEVFDVLGRRIITLADDEFFAGIYTKYFNPGSFYTLSSGILFYRLTVNGNTSTRKMIFIKG